MKNKIVSFLNKKGIKNDLIRNIISMFIIKHTELYGDVISFDALMERFNTNLNDVTLVEESDRIKDTYFHKGVVGQYKGFDVNTIDMYFTEADLKNPQLLEAFIDILIHELTHVAYTIKVNENNYKKQEQHIFGTRELSLDGRASLVEGDNVYMEAIINFIACRILDKTNNGSYMPETTSIFRLIQKIDEKKLINSAFYSNEEQFKECFSVFSDSKKAYDFFTEGMRCFYHNNMSLSTNYYSKGKSIMDNFFNDIFELPSPIKSLSKKVKPIGGGIKPLNVEDIHLR